MSLDNITGYLVAKIGSKGKPSVGVSILKGYGNIRPHLSELSLVALDTLVLYITRNNPPSDPAGIAKLTLISTRIGHEIAARLFDDKLEWRDAVRLGDLFVEAFYQMGYIDIKYPKIKDSSYTVEFTEEGLEFIDELPQSLDPYRLRGTVFDKPKDIDTLMQKHTSLQGLDIRYPIVKGWGVKEATCFLSMKDLPCLQAANKLQQTPWRINQNVLAAVQQVDLTQEIEDCEDELELERLKSKQLKLEYTKRKAEVLKDKTFYQLLDFDYRGRIYYRESILNFQGSDYERGLFLFDEAKIVDEVGLRWLKIHAANSYNQSYKLSHIPDYLTYDYHTYLINEGLESISVDKMSLEDRVLWTENNMDVIEMVAHFNSLPDCEKPVSFLAVCHELVNYYKFTKSGLDYYSSLPVPIDGSNNGWQHLGAISKDSRTGELVGLLPTEIPKDFYVQTAKKLSEITKDEERKDILKRMPMKAIRKGISKRGSMTRAYSAGAQKIAENMYNDLRKEGYDVEYGITEKHCKGFSHDLVKAIAAVCPGPLETMKYLQRIAQEVLAQGQSNVSWVTPSGFFVNYEKFYERQEKVEGTIVGVGKRDKVRHVGLIISDKPDPRGFACGISPNYIHSLDASHMARVITEWDHSFGAVHDSFSTHACDVDDLCRLTKHIFIDMYDYPNYFNMIERSLINNVELMVEQPTLGTLNIQEVTHSDYFFS